VAGRDEVRFRSDVTAELAKHAASGADVLRAATGPGGGGPEVFMSHRALDGVADLLDLRGLAAGWLRALA
jgi:hypothetical protein